MYDNLMMSCTQKQNKNTWIIFFVKIECPIELHVEGLRTQGLEAITTNNGQRRNQIFFLFEGGGQASEKT